MPRHQHPPARLKRRWKRLQAVVRQPMVNLAYFLRAIGFRSLNYLFHNRHELEQPKSVLQVSFWISLSRCAVHLVPMTVFAWLLVLNYWVIYIGAGFSVNDKYDQVYLALFQVAAKVQEIFCLASLATLLLEILRYHLLDDSGIPLGLLSSHIWFMQPSSLLSPEYLTAVQQSIKSWRDIFVRNSKKWQLNPSGAREFWRAIRLVLLLLILALLAAFIGPFSAVLLIPRNQEYPAGGTDYFLNATADELWPNVVTSDTETEACYWPNATQYPVCPCGGYSSLLQRATLKSTYDSINFRPSAQALRDIADLSFLTEDAMGLMPAMISSGGDRNGYWGTSTWQSQPNAYSVVLLQSFTRDWVHAAAVAASDRAYTRRFSSISEFIHVTEPDASADSTYPLTFTRCSQPQNLSQHAETAEFQFIKQFVGLRWRGWSNDNETKTVNISNLRRTPSSHLRMQWIPLSTEDFGPVSVGLLFELPWSRPSDTRLALACTIAAAWVQGPMLKSLDDYSAWYVNGNGIHYKPTTRNISTTLGPNDPEARNFDRRIQLRTEWLNLLAPQAPVQLPINDWKPSTLEHIFYMAGFDTMMQELRQQPQYIRTNSGCFVGMLDPTWTDLDLWSVAICHQADKIGFIERTVARLVTDGLSRRLSARAYLTLPSLLSWVVNGPPYVDDWETRLLIGKKSAINMTSVTSQVTQRVNFFVSGYGYRASTLTDYLATVVAGVYLILSLSHVIWTLTHRTSSSSWDTATELLALAWNSPPAPAMEGTSAQIHRWNTYKQMVRIRARETSKLDPNGEAKSYLELSLSESGNEPAQAGTVGLGNVTAGATVATGSGSQLNSGSSTSDPSAVVTTNSKYCKVRVGKKYY